MLTAQEIEVEDSLRRYSVYSDVACLDRLNESYAVYALFLILWSIWQLPHHQVAEFFIFDIITILSTNSANRDCDLRVYNWSFDLRSHALSLNK